MSSADIVVDLQERSVLGKGLGQLRASGSIPAVIHNHGQPSIHVMADQRALVKAVEEAGKHHPVQLKVGNTEHLALIKDIDFHPVKQHLRHVVFQAIKQNEAVEAEIPVVFKEDVEIPAERLSLLVLKQLDYVEVKALPKDLPDELVVDPSSLAEVGDHITVADIVVPAGVTILTELEHPIATVEMPKDQLAEADAAAASLAEDAGPKDEGEEESTEETSAEESTSEEAKPEDSKE